MPVDCANESAERICDESPATRNDKLDPVNVKIKKNKIVSTKQIRSNDLVVLLTAHKTYYEALAPFGQRVNFPEQLSQSLIMWMLAFNDRECKRCCPGDLVEGNQKRECKAFSSTGPLSFSPSSSWDIVLDAREWQNDKYTLYEVNLTSLSPEWLGVKVNANDTFEKQAKAGRRPRLGWRTLYQQLEINTKVLFNGSIDTLTRGDKEFCY